MSPPACRSPDESGYRFELIHREAARRTTASRSPPEKTRWPIADDQRPPLTLVAAKLMEHRAPTALLPVPMATKNMLRHLRQHYKPEHVFG